MTFHVFVTSPRAGLPFVMAPYTVEAKEVYATRPEAQAAVDAKSMSAGMVALFDAMPPLHPAFVAGTVQSPIAYAAGVIRSHIGKTWSASVTHSNAGDPSWAPGGAGNLWLLLPNPGASAWVSGAAYTLPAQSTYGGRLYQLVQSHTSQFAPPIVPALWTDIGLASLVSPYTRAVWSVVASTDPDYTEVDRAKEA
jgi:hypothetical protein